MTHTTPETHALIYENLGENIHIKEEVNGPRYCPSIESKVLRFKGKSSHMIWLEPEGKYDGIELPILWRIV